MNKNRFCFLGAIDNFLLGTLTALPFILNLYSRNMAEYSFDLLAIVLIALAVKKFKGLSLKNLFQPLGFDIIWFAWIAVILIGYSLNGGLDDYQTKRLIEFLWIPAIYLVARSISLVRWSTMTIDALMFLILAISVYFIADFAMNPPETTAVFGFPNRLAGFFTNPNFFAHSYFLIFLLQCALLLTHLHKKDFRLFLISTATLANCVALFLTYNRSIILCLGLLLPTLVILINGRKALKFLSSLLVIAALVFFSNIGGFKDRILYSLNPQKTYDAVRINLWKANWLMFQENPVFGVGYYNNSKITQPYYDRLNITGRTQNTHTHNEILSFLAGTGILGATIYISLFILFGLLCHKTLKTISPHNSISRGLLYGCLIIQPGFLLAGLADNNFEIHVARNFLVLTWALILFFAHKQNVKLKLTLHKRNGR